MNFMKTFWAALLAIVVANMVLWIFVMMIFTGIAAMMSHSSPIIKHSSILKIDLATGISDSPSDGSIDYNIFGGVQFSHSNSLLQAITAIERAADDDRIEGIYINLSGGGNISGAALEELRAAIESFKDSGKFVVAYNDAYGQGGYYLASVADKVFINPQGVLLWHGLSANVMFYKGLLDKLGVEPQIFRHGTFKSAVEPFMLDRMSPDNKLQMTTLVETTWGTMLHDVSASRGIDSAVLSNYATELAIRTAEDAVTYGFADATLYDDQVMELLSRLVDGEDLEYATTAVLGKPDAQQQIMQAIQNEEGEVIEQPDVTELNTEVNAELHSEVSTEVSAEDLPDNETLYAGDNYYDNFDAPDFVTLSDYIAADMTGGRNFSSKNRVAVIYADGDIVDGKAPRGSISPESLLPKLRKASRDEDIKAVVLRVNSPGGSALASEVIWREVTLLKEKKPVIVSMGSMAASGGYYISCPADMILADRMTLTGSIGVFGMSADISKALSSKLGITVDVAKTNPSADMGSPFRSPSPTEREFIMTSIENVYDTFVGHVSDGRNMTWNDVDAIGQGRVWSGVSALEIGLIDGFGGIADAIKIAADRAGIADNYHIHEILDKQDNLSMLISSLGNIEEGAIANELGQMLIHYNSVKNMLRQQGVQARMPYIIDIQ